MSPITVPDTAMTHPATAWLVPGVPVFLTLAAIMLLALLGQELVLPLLARLIASRSTSCQQDSDPNASLWPMGGHWA